MIGSVFVQAIIHKLQPITQFIPKFEPTEASPFTQTSIFSIQELTIEVSNRDAFEHMIPHFVLIINPFSLKTSKTTAKTLIAETPTRKDK